MGHQHNKKDEEEESKDAAYNQPVAKGHIVFPKFNQLVIGPTVYCILALKSD